MGLYKKSPGGKFARAMKLQRNYKFPVRLRPRMPLLLPVGVGLRLGLGVGVHGSHLARIRVDVPLSAVIIKAVIVWGRTMVGLNISPVLTRISLHRSIPAILRHNRHSQCQY